MMQRTRSAIRGEVASRSGTQRANEAPNRAPQPIVPDGLERMRADADELNRRMQQMREATPERLRTQRAQLANPVARRHRSESPESPRVLPHQGRRAPLLNEPIFNPRHRQIFVPGLAWHRQAGVNEAGMVNVGGEANPQVPIQRPPRPPTVELDPPNLNLDQATFRDHLKALRPGLPEVEYTRAIELAEGAATRANVRLRPYPMEYLTNIAFDLLSSVEPEILENPPAAQLPQPPLPPQLTPEQVVEQMREMFPKVCPEWMEEQARGGMTMDAMVEAIMDRNRNVPKIAPKRKVEATSTELDYFKRPLADKNASYQKSAETELGNRFPRIAINSIRGLLSLYSFNFAPCFKAMYEERLHEDKKFRGAELKCVKDLGPPGHTRGPFTTVKLIQTRRKPKNMKHLPEFQAELDFVEAWLNDRSCKQPRQSVSSSHEEEPMEGIELMECGICCEELPLSLFLACMEGHLYCKSCMKKQATEIVHGLGGAEIGCLETGCKAGFSSDVLAQILTAGEQRKLEERLGKVAIATAGLVDFESCRYCPWGAELRPKEEDKVFVCGGCEREYCRLCFRDWDEDHMGKRCEELETDAAAAARKRKEEALSEVILRRCHKCHTPFTKTEGCNKMTCVCGATSCYICKTQNITYEHFCRHVREKPGQPCGLCKACFLYEDPKKIDEARLKEVEASSGSAK